MRKPLLTRYFIVENKTDKRPRLIIPIVKSSVNKTPHQTVNISIHQGPYSEFSDTTPEQS